MDVSSKNTTQQTFHANLALNDSYNLVSYVKKIINDKFDVMLDSDYGAIYVYKWIETEKRFKNDISYMLTSELKKWISGKIGKKEPMATKEQIAKFIKKYKNYCLKNVDIFLRKCAKLYSLFGDKPLKISDFTDRDYNKLIDDFKSSFGQILNVDDKSFKKMVDDLKNGKEFKVNAKLKTEKEIADLVKLDL